VLAVFFVPAFYVVIQWLIELRNGPPKRPDADETVVDLEPAAAGNGHANGVHTPAGGVAVK
jgi:HAE1 family hydrophobic/amphiphilic exporter-1